MSGKIAAISISKKRGEPKKNVERAVVVKNYGIKGDAHAGKLKRQISLLTLESLEDIRKKGVDVKPGDMAENILVEGINFSNVKVKDRLIFNKDVVCQITQVGKTCHDRCRIYEKLSECSMSDEGIFLKVLSGGEIKCGDSVELKND